jgi:predicted aspartyl protease
MPKKRSERRQLERLRRGLPHYVSLGGRVVDGEIIQDVWLTRPHPEGTDLNTVPWRKLRAIVDTGCTHTAIREDIAAELGLPMVDSCVVGTASSGRSGEQRPIVVGIVLIHESSRRQAIAERRLITSDMPDEMLLGMDLLDGGILTVDLVTNVWEWRMHEKRAHRPGSIL